VFKEDTVEALVEEGGEETKAFFLGDDFEVERIGTEGEGFTIFFDRLFFFEVDGVDFGIEG
jgi:hypothetical protein